MNRTGSGMLFAIVVGAVTVAACSSSSSSSSSGGTGDAGADTATTTKGLIGDPCPNGVSDCTGGLLCATEDPGGGQCYKECAPSTDSDCGDTTKYACSFEGHCYLRCSSQADCKRTGYACKDDVPARPPIKFCDVP